jgi:hypothetical protein
MTTQTSVNKLSNPVPAPSARCWEWIQRVLAGVRTRKVPRRLRRRESPDFATLLTDWCERQR